MLPLLTKPATGPESGASNAQTPAHAAEPAPEKQPAAPVNRRRRRIEGALIFGIPCALYLVAASLLVFRYASFNGDAQARLANAYYVIYSRDPHLAAIGFVWNPLPSLSVLPLLPLKVLWHPLTTEMFAGNIMSAIFMAGAGYQIYGFLRDLRLRWYQRLPLFTIFALNPMIVYYGGNGMSEGIFIFTLIVATRYLARWLADDRTIWLVISATALGFAYLSRNEAVFAAFLAALVVVVVTFVRHKTERRERIYIALVDGFIFTLPFAVCFVGWAIVSWVIVGHPFEQFQSVYGTASQLRVINAGRPSHITGSAAASRALHAANSMAPALPLFALAAAAAGWRRRDLRVLASLAMPGGVLLFAVIAYTLGQTAGWFRYYIMAVPLVIMLTGSILAAARTIPLPSWTGSKRRIGVLAARSRLAGVAASGMPGLACLLVLAAVATTIPSTGQAVLHSTVASEEQLHLDYILKGARSSGDDNERFRYRTVVEITRSIDALHLRHGAILVDNFSPCVTQIVLNSVHAQQFVIPNDEDFQPSLLDPVTFHIEYLIAPPTGGYGSLDAVNRQYPTLHDDGGGISTYVRTFDLPGCPLLSLFKINLGGPS